MSRYNSQTMNLLSDHNIACTELKYRPAMMVVLQSFLVGYFSSLN